jgi:hypothetical protein
LRSARAPKDQLLLGFEEVEQTAASDEANQEATSPAEREVRAACPELPRPASHQADLAGLGEHQADSTEMLPNDNAAVGDAIEG